MEVKFHIELGQQVNAPAYNQDLDSKYFEFGAQFKYQDLFRRLQELETKINRESKAENSKVSSKNNSQIKEIKVMDKVAHREINLLVDKNKEASIQSRNKVKY